MGAAFDKVARAVTIWAGSPPAVIGSVVVVILWAITGPMFHFSDTWQLVINTGTTILTFNMVFLIQATQNRDGAALQVKLDEILRSIQDADNNVIGIEEEDKEKIALTQDSLREVKDAADGNG